MRRIDFIHLHPDWPALTWQPAALAKLLPEVRHRQGLLLGRMSALGFDLRQTATIDTLAAGAHATSAIEGEQLDLAQIRSSVASRLGLPTAGLPAPTRDVEGIVHITLDATRNADQPLTAERLFGWHAALFPAGVPFRPLTVGAYRPASAGPMQVVSGPIGSERVHFVAPSADRIATEMDRLLAWFNRWPQPAPLPGPSPVADLDPLLIAAIAHFWFVTIHPFADGNGRIARAIADLALARADGSPDRFYSMSSQIQAERREYYLVLERQQRAAGTDITPWLTWFLSCLLRAIQRADDADAAARRTAAHWERLATLPLNPRQRTVLSRMLGPFQGFLNTSKYGKLAKCSPDTALRDIRQLVQWGVLVPNPAGGRSTSYRLADPSG
jgi:Fic family protein